jgi:putative transcriptional regulator
VFRPRRIEWNDANAESHFAKHGVRFEFAARIFLDLDRADFDTSRDADGEERRKAVGMIEGKLYTVVYAREARRLGSSPRAAPMFRRAAAMGSMTLDPNNLPQLSPEDRERLEALTDEDITAAALADPDNPPLTEDELRRLDVRRLARVARAQANLTQAEFAAQFRINLGRLRDLEQGRYERPDSALIAYLTVIAREPDAVRRALGPTPPARAA